MKVWIEKYGFCTNQAGNNKGADRTVRMRRLICDFVVGVVVSEMIENADDFCRRSVYVLSFPTVVGNIKGHYE